MLFFGKKKKRRQEEERKRQEELAKQVEIEQEKLRKESEKKAAAEKTKKAETVKKETKTEQKKTSNAPKKTAAAKSKEPAKKSPSGKYEIYPEAGMFKYRLKASNGEILAVSFGYSSRKGAEAGIETFKKNVKSGVFELSTDKSDYSFYTLFNSTGARAILIGEFYDELKHAESAVESVKNFHKTDKIVNLESIPKTEVREEIVTISNIEPNANGKYEVYKETGKWYVSLKASNGEILFVSQGYSTKSNALSGLETIKAAVDNNYFTIAKDKQNRYQFKLYSATKQLILSGETYPVKRSCLGAIDSVIRFSRRAKVIEL